MVNKGIADFLLQIADFEATGKLAIGNRNLAMTRFANWPRPFV